MNSSHQGKQKLIAVMDEEARQQCPISVLMQFYGMQMEQKQIGLLHFCR